MNTVAIIDYGASNLRSVCKALEHVAEGSQKIIVSDQPERILAADRVVFPGQGAIGQCMGSLVDKGLDAVLRECIINKPFLGICMGLQTLMRESDEDGGVSGLNIIPGKVVKFADAARNENGDVYKIPHMGWNNVSQTQAHPLWKGIAEQERFYFVHSFYVEPELQADIAASTDYVVDFTSAVARDNLFAVQFHPEKSQRAGLQLLQNFLSW